MWAVTLACKVGIDGHIVDYECEKIVSVLLNNMETILDFVELKNKTVCLLHVFILIDWSIHRYAL